MGRKIIQQSGKKNNQQQPRKYIEITLTPPTI
jgi:hypothetical protein